MCFTKISFLSEIKTDDWMMVATWMLATIAMWQAIISRNASKHQLRAYISIEPDSIKNWGTQERIVISYKFKNCGLTPAKNVSVFSQILIKKYKEPFAFPATDYNTRKSSTVLFPNQEGLGSKTNSKILSAAELALVEQVADSRLYFLGVVRYEDIFGGKHTTSFCYSVRGDLLAGGLRNAANGQEVKLQGIFEHDPEHNSTT